MYLLNGVQRSITLGTMRPPAVVKSPDNLHKHMPWQPVACQKGRVR